MVVLFSGCCICYLFVLDLVCSFVCSAVFGDLFVFSLVFLFAVYVVECCLLTFIDCGDCAASLVVWVEG